MGVALAPPMMRLVLLSLSLALLISCDSTQTERGHIPKADEVGAEDLRSCDEKLLEGFSADSLPYQLNTDEVGDGLAEDESAFDMNLRTAREAVAILLDSMDCGSDDPELAIDEERANCATLSPDEAFTTVCYLPAGIGYFLVSNDLVQTTNVIFNRWD